MGTHKDRLKMGLVGRIEKRGGHEIDGRDMKKLSEIASRRIQGPIERHKN